MSVKIFITGANGFIGSHLCNSLIKNGETFAKFVGDLTDFENVDKQVSVLNDLSTVYHFAGISNPQQCENDPEKAFSINTGGTFHLLEAIRRKKRRIKLVFLSTSHVYKSPNNNAIIDEDYPVSPSSVYATTKFQSELLINQYFNNYNMGNAVILRLFNHTHMSQIGSFFFPQLYSQIKLFENSSGTIKTGNLDLYRDFSLVSDLISLLKTIHETDVEFKFDSFNVCSGQPRHLLELAKEIAMQLNANINFVIDPSKLRLGEPTSLVGSSSKVQNVFNWHPTGYDNHSFIKSFLEAI